MASNFINNGKISADGGSGGQGGAGGQIHFVQVGKEFTQEGITINDLKNPHTEYFRYIKEKILNLLKKPVSIVIQILVGLVIAYLVFKFGWG